MARPGTPNPKPGRSWVSRLVADVRPLRESPTFRRLWIGTTTSSIGGGMTTFALSLQIFELTHSSAAVGTLGLARGIPTIVFGLFGGSFADAVDRRTLVLVTSSLAATVAAVFALQAYLDLRQLWLLYLLAVVQAVLGAVNAPARRTFVRRLLPAHRVAAGVALNQVSGQTAMLVGPALAGIVTAAAGLQACYLVDAVSFAAALYGMARLPSMRAQGDIGRPGLKATIEGVRFIRRHAILAASFLADIDAMVLGMPIALFPAINAQHFGGAAQTLGLLSAAPAAGGIIGSAVSGPIGRIDRRGRAMLVAVIVWGATIAGFGLTRTLWIALLLLAAAGTADNASVTCRATLVQFLTPERYQGRVTAADYVVGAGGPQVGNFEAGVLGSLTTPAFSAFAGGVATVVGAVAISFAIPSFARHKLSTTLDEAHPSGQV